MAKCNNKKNKNKMCRGGDLLYLLCLISNTLSQLEQSSLHPSTVLHHRLLLQPSPSTPTPPHLQERKKQAATGGTPPLRSQKGLRPFNPLQKSHDIIGRQLRHNFIPLQNCTIMTNYFM